MTVWKGLPLLSKGADWWEDVTYFSPSNKNQHFWDYHAFKTIWYFSVDSVLVVPEVSVLCVMAHKISLK